MADSSMPPQHRLDSVTAPSSQTNPQVESDASANQNASVQPVPTSGSSVHPDSDKERVKMQ